MLSLICKVFFCWILIKKQKIVLLCWREFLCDHQNLAKLADFCDELVKQTNKFFRFLLTIIKKKAKIILLFPRALPHHGNVIIGSKLACVKKTFIIKKKITTWKKFCHFDSQKIFPTIIPINNNNNKIWMTTTTSNFKKSL